VESPRVASPMPVVYSAEHLGHDAEHELALGRRIALHEAPVRAERIRRALEDDDEAFAVVAPRSHGLAPLLAVHDAGLVAYLEQAWRDFAAEGSGEREAFPDIYRHPALRDGMGPARQTASGVGRLGYWSFDTATPVVEGSYRAARAAVDVAMTATSLVVDGGAPVAYGLCRPPGHHAPRAAFGGYCFFNNAAIAAEDMARRGVKVSVLDVDYHHGNGTQQIFYDRADVQYVSLHADPDRAYPYFAGFADEVGTGRGRGTTLNLPLGAGTVDDRYENVLAGALEEVDRFDPALVVVSLGVDTYGGDPIGDLALTTEGFGRCGALVAGLGRPVVVLQEGGYAIEALGANVRAWLRGVAEPGF